MLLCVASEVALLADLTIQAGPISVTSFGNPFQLGLLCLAIRTWAFGWPKLSSSGARKAMTVSLLLLAIPLLQPHADSDGDFHYAYLRSMVIDGDFSLVNEAAWYASGWMRDITTIISDATGYGYSGHTIGLAVLAAPLYVPTHWVMEWLASAGLVALADGYTVPEKMAVALTTLLGVLVGALFTYRIVKRWTSPFPAAMATTVAVLGSPLLCYGYHEGSFAHGLTFGLIAWWFALWLSWRGDLRLSRLARLGLFLGFASIVRPQCALFLVLPWIDKIILKRSTHGKLEAREVNAAVGAGALMVGAFMVGFAPQMLVWYLERGSVLSAPQGPDYLDFTRLAHLKVLFHWNHGLFTWHPIHLIGLLGLVLLRGRTQGFISLLLFGFLLQLSVNAAALDWHAGGAFGQRRLETVIPLAAVGVGALLEWSSKRGFTRAAASVFGVVVVVWNLFLLAQVAEGPIYYTSPIDPGTIWRSQWGIGAERLAMVVPQSPGWRLLRTSANGGFAVFTAALALLAALGWALAWITALLTRGLAPQLARRSGGFPAAWVLVSVLVAAPFTLAHISSERVSVLVRHEGLLKTRNLRLTNLDCFQGCGLGETIPPGERWWEILPHPIHERRVTLVGWLGDTEKWTEGQEIGRIDFHLESGDVVREPLISGKHIRPRNYAYLGDGDIRLKAGEFARTWVEPTSTAQDRPYVSTAASFVVRATSPITAIGITQHAAATYHLDGIAFTEPSPGSQADDSAAEPLLAEMAEPGRAVDFSDVANSDYRYNPFRIHNSDGRWPFYPSLEARWWRASGLRFFIAPPRTQDGPWSTLTTAFADGVAHRVAISGEIRKLAFLWSAFETYDVGLHKRLPVPLADVEIHFPSGRIQHAPVVAHRDVWDYNDRYSSEARQLRTDGFHKAKLHWTEVGVLPEDEPVSHLVIRDINGPSPAGIALFAITAYP